MLAIEEIKTCARLEEIRADWNAIVETSGVTCPFMQHNWFAGCCEHYGNERTLNVLVMRNNGCPVAIVPAWILQEKIRGISTRQLGFISNLDSMYVDLILDPHWREEVIGRLYEYLILICRKGIVDGIRFSQWPDNSENMHALLRRLNQNKIYYQRRNSSVIPYIPIETSWQEFLGQRSAKFRKTQRNIANRIAKLPLARVECITEDFSPEIYNDVLHVSKRAWKTREGISLAASSRDRDFFAQFLKKAAVGRSLMLWILRTGDTPIAVEIDLTDGKKVYALRSDYDEQFDEYSPGSYLEYRIINKLFDDRFREYISGPGINAYKLRWTNLRRNNVMLTIPGRTLKGRAVCVMERNVIPAIKRLGVNKMFKSRS